MFYMVAASGLEPPTFRVWTGRSSQLSYAALFLWLRGEDSNPWPLGYEPNELPTAPPRDIVKSYIKIYKRD